MLSWKKIIRQQHTFFNTFMVWKLLKFRECSQSNANFRWLVVFHEASHRLAHENIRPQNFEVVTRQISLNP